MVRYICYLRQPGDKGYLEGTGFLTLTLRFPVYPKTTRPRQTLVDLIHFGVAVTQWSWQQLKNWRVVVSKPVHFLTSSDPGLPSLLFPFQIIWFFLLLAQPYSLVYPVHTSLLHALPFVTV